jgi:hypothetical protein
MSVAGLLLEGELVEVMACPSIGDVMDTTTAACATSYEVLERFLAGYWTPRTRANYRFILARWLDWCHAHGRNPVGGADVAALEAFIAELKTAGMRPTRSSVGSRRSRRSTAGACASSWWFVTRWS